MKRQESVIFGAALAALASASISSGIAYAQKPVPVGMAPGAIPMPGVGVIPMPGLEVLTPGINIPGAATRSASSNPQPSYGGSYPGYGYVLYGNYYNYYGNAYDPTFGGQYGNPGYFTYSGGSTVTVNAPTYPAYGYTYGYPAVSYANQRIAGYADGSVTGRSTPRQSTIAFANGANITVFNAYAPTYVAGKTILSPFGALYGDPAYIRASSAAPSDPASDNRGISGTIEVGDISLTSGSDAYLSGNVHRAVDLNAAVNDLTRFWVSGDVPGLERRLEMDQAIGIYRGARYAYSLNRSSVLALFEDARSRAVTISCTATDVRRRQDGSVNVYIRHMYRLPGDDTGSAPRAAILCCTLEYVEGAWRLTGLSANSSE